MSEIEPALPALNGVVMELEDCSFPLLKGVVPTAGLEDGFRGVNWALLVGAAPRKQGMERKDLLGMNGQIFVGQGQALARHAAPDVRILIAPAAFNGLAHPDGELATARAAGAAGTLMVASTVSSRSLEEIATAASGPLWFQLYVYRDREVSRGIVARAETAGYRALVLTVDTPMLGRRERDADDGTLHLGAERLGFAVELLEQRVRRRRRLRRLGERH